MSWFLIIIFMQSNTSLLSARNVSQFEFPDQATCESALKDGTFTINSRTTGAQGNALAAFCSPSRDGQWPLANAH